MTKLFQIKTENQLEIFLLNEQNCYTDFINKHKELNKQNCLYIKKQQVIMEKHHIIPKYANGSNESWNLIILSKDDHQKAHELLYIVYKNPEDLLAIRFRQKNSKAYELRIKLSHRTQRLNKTGFFNSQLQSENGKKSGKIQTLNRIKGHQKRLVLEWKKILTIKTCWVYKKTNFKLIIKANECSLPKDVANKLLTYQPFANCFHVQFTTLTSALTKMVKEKKNNAYGWVLFTKI